MGASYCVKRHEVDKRSKWPSTPSNTSSKSSQKYIPIYYSKCKDTCAVHAMDFIGLKNLLL